LKVTLIIVRYKKFYAFLGFLSMAFFRLPLYLNKKISFFKLMGTGKNGTFDKIPDLFQWSILLVYKDVLTLEDQLGVFVSKWLNLFCYKQTYYVLEPIESHGFWDGKKVFGDLPNQSDYSGKIAVLTRATIKLSKLKHFWKNVASVATQMTTAKGFITSYGVGEIPWIKQATFSIWESKEDMMAFAYKMPQHKEVIKKTVKQKWYKEDMFTRFKILEHLEK
jgi:hypothetical protein